MQKSTNSAATWLGTALGQQLLAAEAQLLDGLLADVFGLELLQLGTWGSSRQLLSSSRTRSQSIVAEAADPSVDIVARLTALPIQTASVDAVLLPHTLDFDADPHSIVREVDRVLTGEGQLIVLGFQPLSLWGLRATAARNGYPEGLRQMLRARRVRDWLGLLGYEVVQQRMYLYTPPWDEHEPSTRRILRRGLLNPLPPAAWLIKARKHVYRMTPLRHRFARDRRPVLGAIPTS
ncbi:MAG: methyltransferase domain-containing protein [Pseudomonadota bacterium]